MANPFVYKKSGYLILLIVILNSTIALLWQWPIFRSLTSYEIIYYPVFAFIYIVSIKNFITGQHSINFNLNLFLLVLIALLSYLINLEVLSLIESIFVLSYVAIYFFSPNLFIKEKNFIIYSKMYLILLLIPILIGYLQKLGLVPYYYYSDWYDGVKIERLTGGYSHPNTFGYYTTIGIAMILFLYSIKEVKFKYLFLWLMFVFPAVFLTWHRATWIVALLLVLLYVLFNSSFKAKKTIIAVGIMVVFASGGVFLESIKEAYGGGGFRGRGMIYISYINKLKSEDLIHRLFGNGNSYLASTGFFGTHNDLLRFLYVHGLFGLLLFLLFLGQLWINFWRLFRKSENPKYKNYGFLGIALIIMYLLFSISAEPFREYFFYINFCTITSYIYSIGKTNIKGYQLGKI